MARQNISSGHPYEATHGYSRAVRVGDTIHVSGTTCAGDGAYAQSVGALRIIDAALREAGSSPADVVRTVIYVTDVADAAAVSKVDAEMFIDVKPASTMVGVTALVAPELLVEIEAYAIIDRDPPDFQD